MVGLAVALGCQFKAPLFITDQIPMFELMKQNIALNSLESTVSPLIWDWGQPMPAPLLASPPSIVLAADCVYFEPAFPLLIQTLKDLFEANVECRVFFCFKKRRSADKQFMKMARKLFTITDIEDQDKPVWSREQLFLHEFRKKEVKSGASSKATSGMSTPL